MTIGFFLFEGFWVGEMRHFGGRRKKQMKWQGEKMNRLKPNIRRSTGLNEMPVPQKTLKSACLCPAPSPTSCTHTRTHNHARFPVLNYGGCYQSHFKSVRGDEGLFTFQKRWYSLFTEKHIQLSTLRYQPATILETACILCISLFESHMATKMEIMWLNDVWGWLI